MKPLFIAGLLMLTGTVCGQSIQPDTLDIEEVVVTSGKVDIARRNVPLSISVLSERTLEESTETALLPLLSENIPGLFVTERGVTGFGVSDGAAGQINIRGLGGNPTTRVLILIDGHPQFMGLMGHHLPDAYVSSDAEKVEVIRGPASILYGSNAFGGVINIITKKKKEEGIEARAKAMYGSYNTQKYSGSIGYKKAGFNLYTSLNHDKTDGHRDSSDFRIINGYVRAGYDFSDQWKLFADYSQAHYETSDPGAIDDVAGYRIDIHRGESSLNLENNLPKSQGAFKLYYNSGNHDISDGWHSIDAMYGLMFYQGMKLFPGNTLTIGYDYMGYGGKGSPISTVLKDEEGNAILPIQYVSSDINDKWVELSDHALYTFVQQMFANGLILNAGIRYEMNRQFGNEWIPQIGMAWNVNSLTSLKGSLSKGYRPPSIRELYMFPPANEDLQPERMINAEIGWDQYFPNSKIKTELTLFYCTGDNLIVKVSGTPPRYQNTGSFTNMGTEFTLDWEVRKNLDLHTNYSFIHMKEALVGTPEHNLFVSGSYRIQPFSFHLKLQNIRNLYNEEDGEVQIVEKGYTLLGVRLGYTVNRYLILFVSGDNLLNQEYQINAGYPMPGTTVFGGINLNIKPKKEKKSI